MKAAVLIIVALSNQGYWFGGHETEINARWAASGELPAADFSWDLSVGQVSLASGKVALNGDKPATIRFVPPEVRTQITARLAYRVIKRDGAAELERGELKVQLFPNDLLTDVPRLLRNHRVVIIDRPDGLPKLFAANDVTALSVNSVSRLQTVPADVILVGPNMLDPNPLFQAPLYFQENAGARVLVFEQRRVKSLGGYEVVQRARPSSLKWITDHPLFDGLQPDDLSTWLHPGQDLAPLRLPLNDVGRPLTFWPREQPDAQPLSVDSLLISRSSSIGRTIYCQIPLGPWDTDPRSQILLANAVDYLLSPLEQPKSGTQTPQTARSASISAATPATPDKKAHPYVLQFGTAP